MILQLLESEKLYTMQHLKLIHLSEKLNIPLHDISQTINREFDVNFNEMVNHYRVREARKLIAEKKHDHLTMEAIGFMAGFGSTTSFNNYFRKYFNEKPSDIRNRNTPGEK